MQDTESLVYKALIADAELITLLGGKVSEKGMNRIYNSAKTPNAEEYPRITMFEVINEDTDPADDEPQMSSVNIRIDIWTKNEASLFDICKQTKKTIKNTFNACTVRLESKDFEQDTGVFHKPINTFLLIEQEV